MADRNQTCDNTKTIKCAGPITVLMEAAFLLQPWIATRTIKDYCRLCYQARDGTGFLQSKRAHLAGFNTLLATLKMETCQEFGETMNHLEDAKETCLSMTTSDGNCYDKMQKHLEHTQQLYDKMLEDYKNKYSSIPSKLSPTPPM